MKWLSLAWEFLKGLLASAAETKLMQDNAEAKGRAETRHETDTEAQKHVILAKKTADDLAKSGADVDRVSLHGWDRPDET